MQNQEELRENAQRKIEQLMNRFDEQKTFYLQSNYNETQTRRDFIDPFFKALGWDIDNEHGYAESYREVIHEDRQKDGKTNRAPDYAFRLHGGKRLFFIEAKKPSVLIKDQVEPAFQVRRYGWSAKLPISVVTDFQEFAVYDCTKKPLITDKASIARIKYLTYSDYLTDFDFIWDTFSRERVLQGSFDRFVENDKYKKGTSTLDGEFLQSLDSWRIELAKSICKNNKQLDEDEINFVVQQTIDRIIFLRIAEDRSIEPYGNLQNCIKEGNLYQNLFQVFTQADQKYNSGLFDFNKDKLSRHLEIENKVLRTVINELYYPSPYAFNVFPVEILGTAYEQFLGKQIKISPSHKITIEQKPAVRKAGGVYYTPQYIVDYIVENTVGKLITGKTPQEIERIKIVDPACGSGSFLLGAYEYLLKYHKDHYTKDGRVSKGSKADTLTPEGNLTTNEKKRILLNNIYGVDIDTNAVEVTKLSLLIKCMEGETEASIATQMQLFHERVLPTLDNNIKSGNSLIDTDYYDNELDFGDERKIKPFSWEKGFPEVFKQGGFDAVVGNPPYRLMQPKDTEEHLLNYFKTNYTVSGFKIDLFHLFFQKGIRLLRNQGMFGFITPSSLLNNVYVENLRTWLMTNCVLDTIALTKEKVFADADVFTAVYILQKENDPAIIEQNFVKTTVELERAKQNVKLEYREVKQTRFNTFDGKVWNILVTENNAGIINKVWEHSEKLGDISKINRGLISGDRAKYFSASKKNDKYKPILTGSDINRYSAALPSEYILFERPKTSGGCWDENVHFSKHKIVIRQIGESPTASIIDKPIAVTGNIFTIMSQSLEYEKFLLGVINSRLIEYYWKIMFGDFKSSFPQITIFSLNSIPIKKNTEKTIYESIIKQVDLLLENNQLVRDAVLQSKIDHFQSKIEFSEEKINKLVYELYDLTNEEIAIVEDKFEG